MTIRSKQLSPILSCALLMASCSTSMMVNDNLKTDATVMEVKGRSGGMPGQKIAFGNYASSKTERKIAASEEHSFAVSSQTTRDTMQFEVSDASGHVSKVFCLSKVSQLNLPVASDKYQVAVGSQDVCFGTIVLDTDNAAWDFSIENPNGVAPDIFSDGVISNGQTTISIKEVHRNASGKAMNDRILGFEFWNGQEVIGAVELIGNGKIIVKNSLPQDLKSLIATTAATLLLRYDMGKAKAMQ